MITYRTVRERIKRALQTLGVIDRPALDNNASNLCVVPWMHLNFEPNGKVVPCCLTSHHDYFAGDLNTQSIGEIWNSKNMKDLRLSFLRNEQPKICSTCFDREKVTGESARSYHARNFRKTIEIIPEITESDGTCNKMELKYWDFRFSNLCNFKCRSCGPRYSSAWVPDAKHLGYADQEKVWNIQSVNDTPNYDFLKDQIQHVEKIYFAGGEPLLMPEHWQTLDLLVANQKFDVILSYNTNCSTLTYGNKNVIDYWKQWRFGKIEVWPSIDEIGERAELLRSGTVWHKIEENLIELTKLPNLIIRPGITVGAWNVNRLPEIITHLTDLGVIRDKNFFFNILSTPEHYNVQILPENFRQDVIKKLESFIRDHNKKHRTSIDGVFTHILHELTKPYSERHAKMFVARTDAVDKLRGEDIYTVIPEMTIVRDSIK